MSVANRRDLKKPRELSDEQLLAQAARSAAAWQKKLEKQRLVERQGRRKA